MYRRTGRTTATLILLPEKFIRNCTEHRLETLTAKVHDQQLSPYSSVESINNAKYCNVAVILIPTFICNAEDRALWRTGPLATTEFHANIAYLIRNC